MTPVGPRRCKGEITLQQLSHTKGRVMARKKRGKCVIYLVCNIKHKRKYFELYRCVWKYVRGLAYCIQQAIVLE